jgi:hypothetical protein
MTITVGPTRSVDAVVPKCGSRRVTVLLLGCGVLYASSYAIANDLVAAARYRGYSRTSQAVSELSATGAPTRRFLTVMLPVWTALMVAFGIGVLRSASGARSLRVTGGVLIAFGVSGVAWLAFPMTSRDEMVLGTTAANDVGHLVLSGVTVVLIILQLVFGSRAFGPRFRRYSLATGSMVLVFGALTARASSKIALGESTPWLGLFERLDIGAWLLWLIVFAIACMRRRDARSGRCESLASLE